MAPRLPSPRWSLTVALWTALAIHMAPSHSPSPAPLGEVTGAHEAVEEVVTAAGGGDETVGERRTPAAGRGSI